MAFDPTLFGKHLGRLSAAVARQEVDRVPVILAADSFHARRLGVTLADYISDMEGAAVINLKSLADLGEVDGVEYAIPSALTLGVCGLSAVKLPGRELPENDLWQVEEVALMTAEDYDVILNRGYGAFVHEFLPAKLPLVFSDLMKYLQTDFGKIAGMYVAAGVVPVCSVFTGPPIDTLSAARGMANFAKDMYRMPDKLEAVMDIMLAEEIDRVRQQIRAMPHPPFSVFVGAARGAGEFLAPRFWNRFVLPYLAKLVDAIAAEGCIPFLHFDSNWERDLDALHVLPKDRCIFASDHSTDIFRVKEILGDHMCVMGDVPASMLALSNPDEVYAYSTKLIRDLGPTGFILGVACNTPFNAKTENVKAMISAATGK